LTRLSGSPFPAGVWASSVVIDPLGRYAYVGQANANVTYGFTIDASTGNLSPLSGSPFTTGPGLELAIDPKGRYLFATNTNSVTVSAFAINQSTGALTAVSGSPYPTGQGPTNLIVDPTSTFLYVANGSNLANNISGFRIDQSTGALTPLQGSPFPSGQEPLFLAIATPTPISTLGIQFIQPSHGGNAGTVTMQIVGSGFETGATVSLTGLGADIIGTNTTVPNGSVLTTTFDLTGATPGVANVVVTDPGNSTVTLTGGFTVEPGGAPQISLNIVGRRQIRIGMAQTYYVTYSNSGNVDAVGVPIWVQVPSGVELSIGFDLAQAPDVLTDASVSSLQNAATVPYQVTVNNSTIAGLYAPYVPAGSTVSLPITLAVGSGIAPFQWTAWVFPPYLASATGIFVATNPTGATKCAADLASLLLTGGFGAGGVVLDSLATLVNFSVDAPSPVDLQMSTWQIFANIAKDDGLEVFTARDLAELSGFGNALGIVGAISDCAPLANIILTMMSEQPVTSLDPNDKVGPQGVGVQAYVSWNQSLPYSVYFDNQATATAPAQSVTITDTLDSSLNLSSLTLGPITFPSQVVTPPSIPLSVVPFNTTVDLRPTTNLLLAISASLNTTDRILTWTFQSLDPTTGQPPTDPTAGFLPPGAEGSVFLAAMPKSSVTTGTVIQNTATVVFDANPPINTPTWSNTIDSAPPVSNVLALPATESCPNFRVSWSGSDVGSGIQGFTIYYSDNGGPFVPWLTNVTAATGTFVGVAGH
jgi:hypothetical protein